MLRAAVLDVHSSFLRHFEFAPLPGCGRQRVRVGVKVSAGSTNWMFVRGSRGVAASIVQRVILNFLLRSLQPRALLKKEKAKDATYWCASIDTSRPVVIV